MISFDIEEKNGKSFITLRHMNWKEVTPFYRSCNYNWAIFLYSLKSYCEDGNGIPYQKRKFNISCTTAHFANVKKTAFWTRRFSHSRY